MIAVLGGMGFVGRHLVKLLVDGGSDVLCIDNFSRGTPPDRWKGPYRTVKVLDTDVTNAAALRSALANHEVDTVYNLAASVAGIYYNIDHQFSMYVENWACAHGPITAALNAGVKRFLQVSSVCVIDPKVQDRYYHQGGVPEHAGLYGEPQKANAGYAEAKRDGERLAGWVADQFDRMVVVRPSNIIGPGDHFDDKAHVVPALIRRAVAENELVVYGNKDHLREFVDVRDVARAMQLAMDADEVPPILNIGSGHTISIEDLAYMISDLHKEVPVKFVPTEGGDARRLSNSSRLRALGWEPEHSIHDSVKDCYDDFTT